MATWILGDVHGCADELHALLERLALGPDDQLVCCGDLFHRGPAPLEVARLLAAAEARFVLGNHEHVLLARNGCLPGDIAPEQPPAALPQRAGEVPGEGAHGDLRGDGGATCHAPDAAAPELLEFLRGSDGYYLTDSQIEEAGPTRDGRPWVVVHAGRKPGLALEDTDRRTLLYSRRLSGGRGPWWYERYTGPELVLFGHTPSKRPRSHFAGGKLVALGLDTGCVYGGTLTAYSPELDALEVIEAAHAYAS